MIDTDLRKNCQLKLVENMVIEFMGQCSATREYEMMPDYVYLSYFHQQKILSTIIKKTDILRDIFFYNFIIVTIDSYLKWFSYKK